MSDPMDYLPLLNESIVDEAVAVSCESEELSQKLYRRADQFIQVVPNLLLFSSFKLGKLSSEVKKAKGSWSR